ncbi:hypothetical protein Clacol_003017 [Clathrus columnatus]|uniref:FHA domain-containing protein n=1 Tax=Clathrus columnatus TaxID=1419009 RepID=A0AAV5A6E8_9AGAM|nr:hypothetical protein Clacol_003017 [Clathrus columnatus]
MPRSRSRSRSPRRRREAEREDKSYRYNRDRRRRDEDRYAGDRHRRDRDVERRRYSRERSPRPRYDDDKHDERSRKHHRNSQPRDSRSPSRAQSPSVADADKGKPNLKPSGLLAAETNTVKKTDGTSIVLKYNEPPEARRPTQSWRLYIFKGEEQLGREQQSILYLQYVENNNFLLKLLEPLHIYRQSAYLIGRDQAVCDVPVEHPSCSKQHAVIQYRHIPEKDEFGNVKATVKPFIIDLESTNGTFVNSEEIPPARYYELRTGDVIKFGLSTKEYVLLHEDL